MSKSKSIFAKLKQAQSFEAQVCPILVNGDTGAECIHRYLLNVQPCMCHQTG